MKTKTRKQAIAQYKKGRVYHADYMHTDYFEYWLNNFTKDGRTLNVCCGFSEVGEVRLDIAESVTIKKDNKEVIVPTSRTQYGDVFDLEEFKDHEFDYVYCDPLFKWYTSVPTLKKYKNKWQYELFRLAKKALITRRPKVNINLPSTRHGYVILEDSRPSLSLVRVDWR